MHYRPTPVIALPPHQSKSVPSANPAQRYVYEPERGPVPANGARDGDLVVRGQTLLDLAAGDYARPETREEARALMRALIGERLHGQVLHTRSVLMELNQL